MAPKKLKAVLREEKKKRDRIQDSTLFGGIERSKTKNNKNIVFASFKVLQKRLCSFNHFLIKPKPETMEEKKHLKIFQRWTSSTYKKQKKISCS
jgi:hypothetical protein